MDYREVKLYDEPRTLCQSEYDWPDGEPEMSDFESAFLCGLIKKKRPHKIVEVGVAAGGTTAIILKCIELLDMQHECEMFSVDISERFYRGAGERSGYLADALLHQRGASFKHTFLLGKLLPEVIDQIGSDIDFVIFDTKHVMPGEILDFLSIYSYLKPGATVVLHDIALSHYNRPTLFAYSNQILLRCIVADKYFMYDESSPFRYPNIGAFDINADTAQSISDIVHALTINWGYRPNPASLEIYCKHFERHYGKETASLFTTIQKMQEHTYEKIFGAFLGKSLNTRPETSTTDSPSGRSSRR